MDLSKIPEPSEEEIRDVAWWVERYPQAENICADDWVRVIAHLLRHGRVLASRVVGEFPDNCLTDEEQEAISFFEKFGGE